MADEPSTPELLRELSVHPQLERLRTLVRAAALDAAAARRADFASRFQVGAAPTTSRSHVPEGLDFEGASTPYGNLLELLENGTERPVQRRVLGALLALGIAEQPPRDTAQEDGLAAHLVWLAAHTQVNALEGIDTVLGEQAAGIWKGVANIAEDPTRAASDFGSTEALVAAAALGSSSSAIAKQFRTESATRVQDPAVRAVLSRASLTDSDALLVGEMASAPYGALMTTLLTVTLVLFASAALRAVARLAFAYRRPAELKLTDRGLELHHRIELLGKVLRDRATIVPLSNLVRVTREVRYARLGLYAGLIALVVGTYIGMGLFVDGVRVPGGSATLLGLAVLMMVLGLGVDYLLSGLSDNVRGRCRLVVVQRKGRRLCIGALDPHRADAMLSNIASAATAAE